MAQQDSTNGQSLSNPDVTEPTPPSVSTDSSEAPVLGTVELQGGTAAAGIGYVWGNGILRINGETHAFQIHGLSALDVGGSSINAVGEVMHLTNLKDFAGTYSEFGAGVTAGKGGSAVYLKNQHGVVVRLLSKSTGLRFHLATGGIKVTFFG